MQQKQNPNRLSVLTLAILSSLAAVPALAEEEADATEEKRDSSAEVVEVTARRVTERIQDVPVAVTAISDVKLMDSGAQTLIDIERFVPNLTVNASRATNSTITAYLRGVGQNDPLWGFEPGVGVYIDDVYMARPQGGVIDLLDVQRVEVLRGPQGTLYGKNTIGGAIKYVTRELPDYTRGFVEVAVGSYNQQDIKAGISTPLVEDKLYVGVSAASLSRDGFGEAVAPSPYAGTDVSDKDILAYRANVTWTPTENLRIKFVADDTEDNSNARGGRRLNTSPATGSAPLADRYDTKTSMDPRRQEVTNSGEALTIDWDLNSAWAFKSVTSTREGYTMSDIDFDATEINSFDVPAIYEDEQLTQEFQFTYTGESLSLVTGVYYLDGEACGDFSVLFGLAVPPLGLTQRTYGCVDTISKSAYAQGTYKFTDALSLTLGARYDEDEKDALVGVERYLGIGTPVAPLPGGEFTGTETFDDFSPRIGMEYKFSNDAMAYVSYSHGFKSGGFNMRANPALDPAAATPFQPETVDSVELGFKASFNDNRLTTYAALFSSNYDDKQVPVSVVLPGGGFVSRVLNAASASIDGLELELRAQITDGFSINFMYGYLDATYDEFVGSFAADGSVLADVSDTARFINAPESQYTIGLNYELQVGPGRLALLADYNYRDDVYIYDLPSASPDTTTDQPAYSIYNASAVYYLDNSSWRFALYGRNLGDEEYIVSAYDFYGTAVADRAMTGYYGDPATWTLSAMYSF